MRSRGKRNVQLVAAEELDLSGLTGRALPRACTRRRTSTPPTSALQGRLHTAPPRRERKGTWQLSVTSDGAGWTSRPPRAGGPPAEPQGARLGRVRRVRAGPVAGPAPGRAGSASARGGTPWPRWPCRRSRSSTAGVWSARSRRSRSSPSPRTRKQLARSRRSCARPARDAQAAAAARAGPRSRNPGRGARRHSRPELPGSFFREQYARLLAHDPGVRLGSSPTGPPPAPRLRTPPPFRSEDRSARARSGLGRAAPRGALLARRRARACTRTSTSCSLTCVRKSPPSRRVTRGP